MADKKLTRIVRKLARSKKISSRRSISRSTKSKAQEDRLFETKYGYFASGGREFVIKTPFTPGLWANFLTNGHYSALLTPTGGGYSWEEEAGYNRVLREHPFRHLIEDTPGRYIYIRDQETSEYWSATHQPVKKSDNFKAIHSLGFTRSANLYRKIETEVTYFVPQTGSHEIWWLKIKNNSKKKRCLKFFTYSEFVLGRFQPDTLENSFHSLFTKAERQKKALVFSKTSLSTKENIVLSTYDKKGFIATNAKFSQYELSKRDFIGFGHSLESPVAVSQDKLCSSKRAGENLIGCISAEINLRPGETKQIFFAVGIAHDTREIEKVADRLNYTNVSGQLAAVEAFWTKYIKKVWIDTPDTGLNIWFNYWLKYQTYFNSLWSEMDSFYIGGGDFFGYRDTAQHIWGSLPFKREINMKHLKFLLTHQYPNGSVPHAVSVFTDESVRSPHSDDPCWLVFAVINFLEETGKLDFLKEVFPFLGSDKFGFGHKGSVLKHLLRATDYSLRHLSERGLPQMRVADWNDALSSGSLGKGESFMVAGLLAANLKRMIELLSRVGRIEKMKEYQFAYDRLLSSVATFGWDGEWFLRATADHHVTKIGSRENERGKIFLDSNTWVCMSGLAGRYRDKTLKSIDRYLMTKYGALLFNPGYNQEDHDKGIIAQFAPGSKENASIFLHANAWLLICLSQAGQGPSAFELLKKINPVYRYFTDIDTYKVEPYVLPEFIFGNESDKFGEGSFTWVTGSSEWFLRAILDFFLGVRPFYDKLIFDPKVPKNWTFSVTRKFRGKRWLATYKNGVKKLRVI